MGKIKQGILGGFNGTTGSVVGASWKGIAYMRGKAQSIKNPRTVAQQRNRGRFGYVSDLMSKALSVVNMGYLEGLTKKSPFNAAVQENLPLLYDSHGDLHLERAQFSKGSLAPLASGGVTATESQITAVVNCIGDTFPSDRVISVCLFVDTQDNALFAVPNTTLITGGSQTANVLFGIPANLDYSEAFVFSFAYDDTLKKSSPTCFVGNPE